MSKMQHKRYPAMITVENDSIKSMYTPDTFFDEWSPCVTTSWSRVYDNKTKSVRSEWSHLNTKTQYYTFEIPEKAIHGCLFLDSGKAYFRDYHKGRLSQLRIRSSVKGLNILGAFWIPHEQRIILHDVFMKEGQSICESVFTKRWDSLESIISMIEQDEQLQGFTLEIAPVKMAVNEAAGKDFTYFSSPDETAGRKNTRTGPVDEASSTSGIILQPNTGLAIIIHSIPNMSESTPMNPAHNMAAINVIKNITNKPDTISVGPDAVYVKPDTISVKPDTISVKPDTTSSLNVYLSKHLKLFGPESFQLWSKDDNKDLGMPCIQSLGLIQKVRTLLKNTDKILVEVKWNKNLNAYSVLSIT
jgi:hypothetical protein